MPGYHPQELLQTRRWFSRSHPGGNIFFYLCPYLLGNQCTIQYFSGHETLLFQLM
jgi:hypothetical protein